MEQKKWEHKIVEFGEDYPSEYGLRGYGAQGWELVQLDCVKKDWRYTANYTAIFKRSYYGGMPISD